MLASLQSEQGLVYLNASSWLDEQQAAKALTRDQLRERVLGQGERIFIDFSGITDKAEPEQARKAMEQLAGISFDADWVLVSAYKGELLFTPLGPPDDPAFYQVMERIDTLAGQGKRHKRSLTQTATAEAGLPRGAFYLKLNRKISVAECTFPRSRTWDRGDRLFCDSPNISLVYRVNLERSLQFGNTGSATPDAKIVRISLDDESAGGGIQLNEDLTWSENIADYLLLDGWARDYATDAIAQDYRFTIDASNTKAAVLKSLPTNLNSKYEHRRISGFEVGVTGGVEVNKDGPKASWRRRPSSASSVTMPTTPRIIGSNARPECPEGEFQLGAGSIRDGGVTALLQDRHRLGNGVRCGSQPHPAAELQGLRAESGCHLQGGADETGSTEFKIDSSVNIRPIYTGIYKHYYVVGGHVSFQGFEDVDKRRRVTASTSFKVDWNHPVFTGGRPVNLQLGGFDNRCLSAGAEHGLSAVTCDETSAAQSFIYDQYGRYVSALDTRRCLDGNNLGQLQSCRLSLGQRWEWKADSDALSNLSAHQLLGHNKQTGELALYDENGNPADVSVRTLTSYTRILRATAGN
uniref:Hemolysin 4 n=1 Tax=Aeromonas salmonicida TaxID=645 RepID=HLY4_AERSA|nr:RecName: Full=Hemolysin 4; Flags: Precursor [Aeromonas salmonicida]CAA46185.1 hemolysin (aerolysin) [Aeromonas salmonicida]